MIRSLGDDVLGYDQIMRQYCLQDLIAGGPCVKILEAPQLIVRQSTAAARTGR